jgi:hypothetical protein
MRRGARIRPMRRRLAACIGLAVTLTACPVVVPIPTSEPEAPPGEPRSALYVVVANQSVEDAVVGTSAEGTTSRVEGETRIEGCSVDTTGVSPIAEGERFAIQIDGREMLAGLVPRLDDGVSLLVEVTIDATGAPRVQGPVQITGEPERPTEGIACR